LIRGFAPGRLICAALGTLAVACGGAEAPQKQPGTLEVYAASSLTEAFTELETLFESENIGTDVLLTFAGSQVLRVQIEQGAAADVYASANMEHLESLESAGFVRNGRVFARNDLVVIVPVSNPAGIESFDDLPKAGTLVLGASNVPVGTYAREAIRRGGERLGAEFESNVLARLASEEANVRLVRAKIELDEADAAIVYRTDAAPSDLVRVIEIPESDKVVADYPIGVVTHGPNPGAAERWVELVLSERGREVLAGHGFLLPCPPKGGLS
jgi:molybdate transport system substrate-binding protein